LAQIGLIDKIFKAAISIDAGRKGFAIIGKADEGRISFEKGIALAMAAFLEAQATFDPLILILAEWTFLSQEFEFLRKDDTYTINSLKRAIKFFDDAFLALKVVEDRIIYNGVEQAIPHDTKYRYKGYPLDAYHVACHNHKTRLQNILKTPGLDPIEKDLLKQRLANMKTAQEAYAERQKKALSK